MNQEQHIFDKIKKAAQDQETQSFASADKVWANIENRLEHQHITKGHNRWKITAIAASVLLVAMLSYEMFHQNNPIETQQQLVNSDSIALPKTAVQEVVVEADVNTNPQIKEDAPALLQKQLQQPASKVVIVPASEAVSQMPAVSDEIQKNTQDDKASQSRFQKRAAFESVSVRKTGMEADTEDKKTSDTKIIGNSAAPLVVIDGKAVTGKAAKNVNSLSEGLQKADPKDEKEVTILKEPLYIIDGHYYSEEDLFGPNPSSPYAPLNQQEIETVTVFQGEKAIANYGKRGEKGVVVIVTKNRKPATAKPASAGAKAKAQ